MLLVYKLWSSVVGISVVVTEHNFYICVSLSPLAAVNQILLCGSPSSLPVTVTTDTYVEGVWFESRATTIL